MVLLDDHSNINPRRKVCRVSGKVLALPPSMCLSPLVLLVAVWLLPTVSPDLWLQYRWCDFGIDKCEVARRSLWRILDFG